MHHLSSLLLPMARCPPQAPSLGVWLLMPPTLQPLPKGLLPLCLGHCPPAPPRRPHLCAAVDDVDLMQRDDVHHLLALLQLALGALHKARLGPCAARWRTRPPEVSTAAGYMQLHDLLIPPTSKITMNFSLPVTALTTLLFYKAESQNNPCHTPRLLLTSYNYPSRPIIPLPRSSASHPCLLLRPPTPAFRPRLPLTHGVVVS